MLRLYGWKLRAEHWLQGSGGNGNFGSRIELWAYKLNRSRNLMFSMVNTLSNTVKWTGNVWRTELKWSHHKRKRWQFEVRWSMCKWLVVCSTFCQCAPLSKDCVVCHKYIPHCQSLYFSNKGAGDDVDKSQEEQLRQNARQISRCLYQEPQLSALREESG